MHTEALIILSCFDNEIEAVNYLLNVSDGKLNEVQAKNLWQKSLNIYSSTSLNVSPGRPKIESIRTEYLPYALDIMNKTADELYLRGHSWKLRMLEIDPLISSRVYIEVDKVKDIIRNNNLKDMKNVLEICLLPKDSKLKILKEHNSITYFSSELDSFWVEIVDKLNFNAYCKQLPVIAMRIHDLYVLVYGHHRAVALREKKVKYIPCLLIDDINMKISAYARFFVNAYFRPKPPIIGYFTNRIAQRIQVQKAIKMLRLQVTENILEGVSM